jgi:predicted membrane protein
MTDSAVIGTRTEMFLLKKLGRNEVFPNLFGSGLSVSVIANAVKDSAVIGTRTEMFLLKKLGRNEVFPNLFGFGLSGLGIRN